MVTSRVPVLAFEAIVMFAVKWLAWLKVVELTVIPEPNDAASAGPLSKLVPVIVTFWLVAPCPREAGLVEDTVGGPLTVNAPLAVAVPAPGLVTVTSRGP